MAHTTSGAEAYTIKTIPKITPYENKIILIPSFLKKNDVKKIWVNPAKRLTANSISANKAILLDESSVQLAKICAEVIQ